MHWSSSFHNIFFSNVKIQQQLQFVEHHFFLFDGHSWVIWLERVDLNFLKEKRCQDSIFYLVKRTCPFTLLTRRGSIRPCRSRRAKSKECSCCKVADELLQSCCKPFSTCRSSCLCVCWLGHVSIQIENAKNCDKCTLFCVEMVKKFFTLQQLSKSWDASLALTSS